MTAGVASLRPRLLSRFPSGWDGLLALVLAGSQAFVVVAAGEGAVGVRAIGALAALGFLALAWRRRYPLAVLVVTFVAGLTQELVEPGHATPVMFLAIVLASYSLGAHASRRSLVAGVMLGVVGWWSGTRWRRRCGGSRTRPRMCSSRWCWYLVRSELVGSFVRAASSPSAWPPVQPGWVHFAGSDSLAP